MSQFMIVMSDQFTITLEQRFQAGVNFCQSRNTVRIVQWWYEQSMVQKVQVPKGASHGNQFAGFFGQFLDTLTLPFLQNF